MSVKKYVPSPVSGPGDTPVHPDINIDGDSLPLGHVSLTQSE